MDAHIDTKMLVTDWPLFIAANQKPAFWCRCVRCGKNVGLEPIKRHHFAGDAFRVENMTAKV